MIIGRVYPKQEKVTEVIAPEVEEVVEIKEEVEEVKPQPKKRTRKAKTAEE